MMNQTEPRAVLGEEVLTVGEVATYLRVTTRTVYDLMRRGELPSFRVGRAVRCRRLEVERFIATRTDTAAGKRASPGVEDNAQEAAR